MSQRPGGIVQIFTVDGCEELHSKKCCHCQGMVTFPSMKKIHRYMDVCRNCFGMHCLDPACLAKGCVPWQKWVDEQEQIGRQREAMLRDMGII